MSRRSSLLMPWARNASLYSAPGRVVLKLAAGETPDSLPCATDIRFGARAPAEKIDGGGPVDRILRQYAGNFRAARVHTAAASLGVPGHGHQRFDDLEVTSGLARTLRVELAEECSVADLLSALAGVASVEEASPFYLCSVPMESTVALPFTAAEAALSREMIHADEALGYEPGDPAVIVAVVDTGVSRQHAELPRLRPGFDTVELGTRDLARGLHLLGDREGPDTDPSDEVGHGTGCAGIIGASGRVIPPGLAGDCGVLPIRVLGAASVPGKDEPIGIGALPDIDAGIKMAVDLGARVLNLSLGTADNALDEDDPYPHADAVNYALMRGCVVVSASGNSGQEEKYYPAALEDVVAVGAVNDEGQPTSFSTRGDHVDICAPGERVASTGLSEYQRVTGTSFAAPFVSAVAALMMSRALRRSYPLDARLVSRLLKESAQPWPAGQGAGCGVGVLDAHAALRRLDEMIDRRQTVESFVSNPT
jgi:subtilisin family serine protease